MELIEGIIKVLEPIHRGDPLVVVLTLLYALTVWGFIRTIRYFLARIEKLEAEKEALQQLNAERLDRAEARMWSIWERMRTHEESTAGAPANPSGGRY